MRKLDIYYCRGYLFGHFMFYPILSDYSYIASPTIYFKVNLITLEKGREIFPFLIYRRYENNETAFLSSPMG